MSYSKTSPPFHVRQGEGILEKKTKFFIWEDFAVRSVGCRGEGR